MADIFEEVDEEVRRDRYLDEWRKYGPWVISGAAAIVLGTAGWQFWDYMHAQSLDRASDSFIEAQTDFEADRLPDAATGFELLMEEGTPGYQLLATLQRAAVALEAGANETAAEYFDQAAEQSGDPVIRDLATLKAVWARWATLSATDIGIRLRPLTNDDRPYRYLALESIAAAALRDGDLDQAESDYQYLLNQLSIQEALSPGTAPAGLYNPQGIDRIDQALGLIAQRRALEPAPEAPIETPVETPEEAPAESESAVDTSAAGEDTNQDETAQDAEEAGND